MYPELFTIPGTSYTISTFGVMMAIFYSFAGRPPSLDDKDW